MGKLTAKEVSGLTAPGRYTDGDGLMLYVDSQGRRYWQLRYRLDGKRRDLSLGPVRLLSLRDARDAALAARMQIRGGVDPLAERKAANKAGITFAEAARKVHTERAPAWKNGKHYHQWLTTLETHAFPLIGDRPIVSLTRADMVKVLSPIWLSHEETARRVLQRMQAVIAWSVGEEIRENGIDFAIVRRALPRQRRRVKNMQAIHYTDVPAFLHRLAFANAGPVVRAAIELMILTASRPGNIRFMEWPEVDIDRGVWCIPAAKMKMDREHHAPLMPRAIALLRVMESNRSAALPWVFPGDKPGKAMSENTLCKAIRDMGVPSTAHGFRSCFKDWSRAAKWEDYLSEFQLAHADDNKSRQPYGRDGQLALRREMTAAWAAFVAGAAPAPSHERLGAPVAVSVAIPNMPALRLAPTDRTPVASSQQPQEQHCG